MLLSDAYAVIGHFIFLVYNQICDIRRPYSVMYLIACTLYAWSKAEAFFSFIGENVLCQVLPFQFLFKQCNIQWILGKLQF